MIIATGVGEPHREECFGEGGWKAGPHGTPKGLALESWADGHPRSCGLLPDPSLPFPSCLLPTPGCPPPIPHRVMGGP